MRNRIGNARLAIAGLLSLLGGVSTAVLAQDRPLAGRLVDERGGGVGDATLFLMPVGRPRRSAEIQANLRDMSAAEGGGRVTRSATDGSFSALLPAGRYRIAAFKSGYEVSLTEVHLLARSRVEITMRPVDGMPGGKPVEGEGQSGGLDWILRQPDGNVLRDRAVDLGRLIEEGAAVPPAGERRAAFWTRLPFDGEFVQHLSGGSLLGGEGSGPGDSSGRSTRLALKGPVGNLGSWRFDGRTGRTTTALDPGADLRRGRRSSGVGIGLDYQLGPRDGLQAEMSYGTSRYLLDAHLAPDYIDQEEKTTGVRTRWDRRLGGEMLLHVDTSYLQAGVRQPAGLQGPGPVPPVGGPGRNGQVDRSLGAAAGLAFRSDAHDVGLAVRVHSYRYDLGDGGALLASFDAGPVSLETGGQGSAVSLSGQDDWRVAERSTVRYGLGYHNDWAAGSSYFAPTVGLTCALSSAGDLLLRSALVYRIEDRLQPAPGGAAPGRPDESPDPRNLGWEIGVERRPENRLRFAATLSYRPFLEMGGSDRTARPALQDEGVPVLADAAAGRHEMGIEVGRGFGVVRGSLAGSLGRVEGRLSPRLQESPLQGLKAGEARYYLTSLRAEFEPTETELRIDYRRVTGETEAAAGAGNDSLDYRRLDLAVYQNLPWVAIANSRWRVLMAYQGLQYDSLADPALSDSGATSRVTGGVDISF